MNTSPEERKEWVLSWKSSFGYAGRCETPMTKARAIELCDELNVKIPTTKYKPQLLYGVAE